MARTGLSPCGESGLKLTAKEKTTWKKVSLPVWGEWIEISSMAGRWALSAVSPRVGRVD